LTGLIKEVIISHPVVMVYMDSDEKESVTDEEQAAIFAAFSDPTRLKLVHLLAYQEIPGAMCVNALADALGVTQSAVSQHLRILKSIGLVTGERRGYRIHYAINNDVLKHCHDIVLSALALNENL
jgi:DNA-binding transcriptional ArsR family regulator